MEKMLLIMAGAAALAGCESLITGGDLIREGLPTATLVFQNSSTQPIDTVLISTCEASSYGLDRLPEGVTVYPGQRHRWTVSAGCYDVMAGAVGVGSTPGGRINVRPGETFTVLFDGKDD